MIVCYDKHMHNRGFTVVELVITIAVVAILAGITAVGYSIVQSDTAKSTLEYDLQAAATAMEQERNFSGSFPSSLPTSYSQSKNSTLTVMSTSTTSFCIRGVSTVDTKLTMRFRKTENEPRVGNC